MMQDDSLAAPAGDIAAALAMAGDLAMGHPAGHSPRVARLAACVAAADGAGAPGVEAARVAALLRWCGATASAAGFARLLGDDVAGRGAMLARTLPRHHPLTFPAVAPLARAQCEVAACVAQALRLPPAVDEALRHAFEHADGGGLPARLPGGHVPPVVFHAALASDLDVLSHAHGPDEALRRIGRLAGRKYPADLVRRMVPHARDWLDAPAGIAITPLPATARLLTGEASLALVTDVLELKLPWLTGYGRRVAALARGAATLAGLPQAQVRLLERAALLHGIGRAAIPNPVWERNGRLRPADWHAVRRAPYWTSQLAAHVPALADEAQLAAHAYERLDGSGYFRRLSAEALSPAHRLLAAAAAWTALCAPRPWRAPYEPAAATALLAAQAGRFDRHAVQAVIAAAPACRRPSPRRAGLLTDRELDVLRQVGSGTGLRETARALRLGTGAVRAHVDSIFVKLECTTRPAAVLKALALGLA